MPIKASVEHIDKLYVYFISEVPISWTKTSIITQVFLCFHKKNAQNGKVELDMFTMDNNMNCLIRVDKSFLRREEVNMITRVMVSEDPEVLRKALNICFGIYTVCKQFNYYDAFMRWFGILYNPKDIESVYDAESLHASQFVVLTLRACLDAEHPVRQALKDVNSRSAVGGTLSDAFFELPSPHNLHVVVHK